MHNQRVSIHQPCHMKWKELDEINHSKNRHCNECSIDIIDFTQMSNEAIIEYLAARKSQKVCAKMYSTHDFSRLSKVQAKVLNCHEYIKSNTKNSVFRSAALALIGLMIFTTGCVTKVGEPAPPCRNELVPDTTTTEPNDSVFVEICE